ncbi:hypothetical protein ACHAXA_007154 [Cyclostephanos tholiformis]|uniref:Uncharacterized protein n=1 Tax=Cyclostephanos tholiformis TaxID=382380 RepID=A0ABD3RRQ1_9STRA
MRLPGSKKAKKDGIGSALSKFLSHKGNNNKHIGGDGGGKDSPLLDRGMEMSSDYYRIADGGRILGRPPKTTTTTSDDGHDVDPTPRTSPPAAVIGGNNEMRDAVTTGGGGGRETDSSSVPIMVENDDVEGGGVDVDDGGRRYETAGSGEDKVGHKFLLVCCDTKRAVIVLTSIALLLDAFAFSSTIIGHDASTTTDGFATAMVVRGCGIFVTLCALLGAFWYSMHVVGVGLVYTTYQLTMDIVRIVGYDWSSGGGGDDDDDDGGKLVVLLPLVLNALIFYAEGTFISEINDGIMSKETYKTRERYSCCCARWW